MLLSSKVTALKKKTEFQELYNQHYLYKSKYYIFLYQHNPEDKLQFGIVISKKKESLSVKRNKVKRRTREALSGICQKIVPAVKVVIIPKKKLFLQKTPFALMQQDIARFFHEKTSSKNN